VRIYADTSFLVSLLYPADVCHQKARNTFASYFNDDWLTSDWSQFETVNSLRQLCLAGLSAARAEALVRLFKQWHKAGPFELVSASCEEALRDCRQLSAAHANTSRMRSADVLHVALLEQIAPDLFLTRDGDQFALAQARGFKSLAV
jgi:predicted nucleic acid-binding protein